MKQLCIEKPELVELCQRCEHEDCEGENGCKTYRNLKSKLEAEARKERKRAKEAEAKQAASEGVPGMAIMFEETPVMYRKTALDGSFDMGETLKRCNAAIVTLEALNADPGIDKVVPGQKVREMLELLRVARIETYSAYIDWNSIADSIKRGREAK